MSIETTLRFLKADEPTSPPNGMKTLRAYLDRRFKIRGQPDSFTKALRKAKSPVKKQIDGRWTTVDYKPAGVNLCSQ